MHTVKINKKRQHFYWLAFSTITTSLISSFYSNSTRLEDTQSVNNVTYLTVMIAGRLGNHMFQVASLIGIAKTLNKCPVIAAQTLESLAVSFPNLPSFVKPMPHRIAFKGIRQQLPACCSFDPTLHARMQPQYDYLIDDWVLSWKYCKLSHIFL